MKCECGLFTLCEICGTAFKAKRSTARFCSDRCRIRNHRPSIRDIARKLYKHDEECKALITKDTEMIDQLMDENDKLRFQLSMAQAKLKNQETKSSGA